MTYKYVEVRREIYERCSDKPLKKHRSFKDLKRLLKGGYGGLLFLALACLGGALIVYILAPQSICCFIPLAVAYGIIIVMEFSGEKRYHSEERKKELSEKAELYEQYIMDIEEALRDCGIDDEKKRAILKAECEGRLSDRVKPYTTASSRAFDMLIGVPVGLLISSFMHRDSDVLVGQILGIIVIGLIIIACVRLLKFITYYSDGYFKDRFLLNALNELEYNI